MMGLFCLAGCSKGEEDPTQDEQKYKEQVETMRDSICFNGKFVEREFENAVFQSQNLKVVTKQKDYTFTADGKGKLTTYFINETAEGHKISEENFTWSFSNTPPLSLKIKIGQLESFVLEEVSVDKEKLSFKSGDWAKELIVTNELSEKDIISYSVENLHGWNKKQDMQMFVYTTPAILTVNTKSGTMRFIRGRFGYNAIGFPHGLLEKNGGEYTLCPGDYEADIYFCVISTSPIFYDVDRSSEKLGFKISTNSHVEYNFPIGHIAEDHSLTFLDNGKTYTLE